jgi:phosphohistidine phosphatase SixA
MISKLFWKEREDVMAYRFFLRRYKLILACSVFILVFVHSAAAQQAIFIVRHAEQALDVENPPLTEPGRRRATALAVLLKDSGINAIYESGIQRTSETAKAVADALNIEPKTYPRSDIGSFIGRLRSQHAQDRVLIVTQSLRISRWLKALGDSGDITIAPTDYNNLFIIIPKGDGSPLVMRLHY